jgi:DNA-binding NarL/FixJ family response regulator
MAVPRTVAVHAERLCYAEALAAYLALHPGTTVLGFTSHWSQTERWSLHHLVDVVVVDLAHYSERALARLRRLRRDRPSLRLVVICEHVPAAHIAALRAIGVAAFVRYRMGLEAVLAAVQGEAAPPLRAFPPRLTGRELEVLDLIRSGRSVTEIAERLGISPRTVENHKRSIFRKLGVSSREGAVSRAAILDLLPPSGGEETFASTGRLPNCEGMPQGMSLTGRERDILQCIAQGDSVRQTARALGVAEKTVENLQSLLYRKLGVHNRVEALAVAVSQGLMPPAQPCRTRPEPRIP